MRRKDYLEISLESRKAWFDYKKTLPKYNHSFVAFTAGWNACRAFKEKAWPYWVGFLLGVIIFFILNGRLKWLIMVFANLT